MMNDLRGFNTHAVLEAMEDHVSRNFCFSIVVFNIDLDPDVVHHHRWCLNIRERATTLMFVPLTLTRVPGNRKRERKRARMLSAGAEMKSPGIKHL